MSDEEARDRRARVRWAASIRPRRSIATSARFRGSKICAATCRTRCAAGRGIRASRSPPSSRWRSASASARRSSASSTPSAASAAATGTPIGWCRLPRTSSRQRRSGPQLQPPLRRHAARVPRLAHADDVVRADGRRRQPDERSAAHADEGPIAAPRAIVSPALFEMLGVSAQLGRTLIAADERPDADAAVISAAAWQRFFGSDPAVLGRADHAQQHQLHRSSA